MTWYNSSKNILKSILYYYACNFYELKFIWILHGIFVLLKINLSCLQTHSASSTDNKSSVYSVAITGFRTNFSITVRDF